MRPPESASCSYDEGTQTAAAGGRDTRHISKDEWLKRLQMVDVFESDIHRVIMNYFSVCGHEEAARAFMKETNTQPEMRLECLSARRRISEAVMNGDVEKGINLINSMEPGILQVNPDINFCLRRHQLLSLLSSGEIFKSLEFAQKELAPCVRKHVHLLPQLEEVMTLLALPKINKESANRQFLVDDKERREVAHQIDDAILEFYNVHKEPLLQSLVKNLHWTQKKLQNRKVSFPHLVDIRRGGLRDTNSPTDDKLQADESTTFPGLSVHEADVIDVATVLASIHTVMPHRSVASQPPAATTTEESSSVSSDRQRQARVSHGREGSRRGWEVQQHHQESETDPVRLMPMED